LKYKLIFMFLLELRIDRIWCDSFEMWVNFDDNITPWRIPFPAI